MTSATLLSPCLLLLLLCALAQQAEPPVPAQLSAPIPIAPPPLVELREIVAELERGAALAVIERAAAVESALAADGGGPAEVAARTAWTRERRAHLSYIAGLAEADAVHTELALETPDAASVAKREEAAVTRFVSAVGLAGPGELRARSLAAPGALIAQRGERQVKAAQSQAMLKPSPIPYAAKTPERVQLDEARAAFERARALLVDRLLFDWHDVDTRANLEWVGRRLAEIRRIEERADQEQEEQDKEEQDKQDQGDQGDQSQNDQGDQSDQGDKGQQGDDGQEGDQPKNGDSQDDQGDQGGQGDETDDSPESNDKGDDGSNTDAPAPDDETGGDGQTDAQEQADGSEGDGAPALPATLGDVEVQRLLNRLAEIEQNGVDTRRRLRASQRRRVERDW